MEKTFSIRFWGFCLYERVTHYSREKVSVTIYDTYDFNKGNETGDGIGSTLNNIGYLAQESGLGTPFDWEINYEYYTAWHKI